MSVTYETTTPLRHVPPRWMRYTCNKTHKQSSLPPSRSFKPPGVFLPFLLPFLDRRVKRQQTRWVGSVPGKPLIRKKEKQFRLRLPAYRDVFVAQHACTLNWRDAFTQRFCCA